MTRTGCLKSPVSRMGGKSYLASWLTRYIPEHVCYVEPFAGAGHLLFAKTPSAVEILNDADSHLINFFRVIQKPETRQALIKRLAFMPYSRALWQDIRSRWKVGDIPQDEVERSVWWFYLNRTCFGGDQRRGGFAVPSITGRNPAASYCNVISGLESIAQRLKGVTIECLSYEEVIQRYDSPDTLFYCDPPYLDAEHYYEHGNFNHESHRTLARLLHEVKGKVLITHYRNELYDKLYAGWNKYTFESFKSSNKASSGESKPKTVECLWTNFKPAGRNRSLFKEANL